VAETGTDTGKVAMTRPRRFLAVIGDSGTVAK
jgi:hypothetical protein